MIFNLAVGRRTDVENKIISIFDLNQVKFKANISLITINTNSNVTRN